jgi:hypothetical protein
MCHGAASNVSYCSNVMALSENQSVLRDPNPSTFFDNH